MGNNTIEFLNTRFDLNKMKCSSFDLFFIYSRFALGLGHE